MWFFQIIWFWYLRICKKWWQIITVVQEISKIIKFHFPILKPDLGIKWVDTCYLILLCTFPVYLTVFGGTNKAQSRSTTHLQCCKMNLDHIMYCSWNHVVTKKIICNFSVYLECLQMKIIPSFHTILTRNEKKWFLRYIRSIHSYLLIHLKIYLKKYT